MIKSVISKLSLALYFVLGAIILEFITFKMLNFGVAPEYFLLNFSIILIIALAVYCIPNFTAQYVIYTILLFVQTVFIYINYSLLNIYGDLFSFDMFRLVTEAAAAMTSSFVFYSTILQLVSVFLSLALFGFIMLHYCKKTKIKLKQHYSIFNIILILGIQFLSCGYYIYERNYINDLSYLNAENYVDSDTFLMNTNFLKENSYAKFGTYGYWLNLFVNGASINNKARNTAAINYFNSGSVYDNSEVFGIDGKEKKNNVIVFMMESLEWFTFTNGDIYSFDETTNSNVYDSNKVLSNLSYELTPNIYALIYGDDYLTDVGNSNTANDGLISSNFYAKSKTNISEGQGIIGNYPVGETLSSMTSNEGSFQYALPNILKTYGYTTSFVHSNVTSFYSRSSTHKALGFDNVIGKELITDADGNKIYTGSDLNWNNWDAEGDFARNAMNYIVPSGENPFYTFYLNVSTHGAYTPDQNLRDGDALRYYDYVKYGKNNCVLVDENGNQFLKDNSKTEFANKQEEEDNIIEDVETLHQYYPNAAYRWKLPFKTEEEFKNWDENTLDEEKFSTYFLNLNKYIADKEFLDMLVYYECGVAGLDEAIGAVVTNLKQKGIYDNTTLLLYSDHYCYYSKVSNRIKGYDINDAASIGLNTIPMIISSPGLKQLMVDKKDELANKGYDFTLNERFCSAYDVVPTILDLLGIKFNENFYMGHSLFRPADYTYEIDGVPTDMVVYYSNTGGLFSKDIYTFNMIDFFSANGENFDKTATTVNYYTADGELVKDVHLTDLFKSEATNLLIKLNYLHILNKYNLYSKVTNI